MPNCRTRTVVQCRARPPTNSQYLFSTGNRWKMWNRGFRVLPSSTLFPYSTLFHLFPLDRGYCKTLIPAPLCATGPWETCSFGHDPVGIEHQDRLARSRPPVRPKIYTLLYTGFNNCQLCTIGSWAASLPPSQLLLNSPGGTECSNARTIVPLNLQQAYCSAHLYPILTHWVQIQFPNGLSSSPTICFGWTASEEVSK